MTLQGTCLTFYKIPVTMDLLNCVERGTVPEHPTEVAKFAPKLPDGVENGALTLGNRKIILQCCDAFKDFVFWF